MKIKIKNNPKLKLLVPEFVCDHNPIGEHLNKYDMLKHLNSFSCTAIIGKPGSGKTSLLISFLTGKKKDKVFFYSQRDSHNIFKKKSLKYI
jgi:ABC-type phosphate/phosphonate transport system ATPase subunit